MNKSTVSRKLEVTYQKEEYDENAKYLLAEKVILSQIVKYTIPEMNGFDEDDIISMLEGEPQVSVVGIHPGEANPSIVGMNTENVITGEGKVTYDIRFHLRLPDTFKQIRIQVDLEAQKSFYPGYDIVTRGVYNSARMISAQKNTEFMNSNYQDIKPVYSIWICMNVPKYARNTITMYGMKQENVVGDFPADKGYYDIPHVVIIGLADEVTDAKVNPLLRMLETIFSESLELESKKRILEEEYHIPMTENLERRMNEMCNLSEGIWERGVKQGRREGKREGKDETVKLSKWLIENGRLDDWMKAMDDNNYLEILLAESGI